MVSSMGSSYDVKMMLEKKEYKKIYEEAGKTLYFKCIPRVGQRCVIVLESLIYPYVSDTSLERIRKSAMHFEAGLKMEETLIVYVGDKAHSTVQGTNFIIYNAKKAKLELCRVEEYFKPEKEIMKNAVIRRKAYNQKVTADLATTELGRGMVPIASWILVILNIIVFAKTFHGGAYTFGISTDSVLYQGESYRLVSYMFMHASFLHLFANMSSLIYLGNSVIRRCGNINFTITYLCGGVMAGLFSAYAGDVGLRGINTITVGASGAVFAILGALFIDVMTNSNESKRNIISYCIFVLITSNINPSVDIPCHLGGFISGILLMAILKFSEEATYYKRYVDASKKEKNAENA